MSSQETSHRAPYFKIAKSISSGFIINYHNQMKRLIQNEIVWFNEQLNKNDADENELREIQDTKDLYLNEYLYFLRSNVFLMLFSHLEEWLEHARRTFSPNVPKRERASSIGRFSPVLQDLGIDLGKNKNWSFLADCAYVRDCLLHANGRVSMSKQKDKLKSYIKGKTSGVILENDRIKINGGLVQRLSSATESLMEEIHLSVST